MLDLRPGGLDDFRVGGKEEVKNKSTFETAWGKRVKIITAARPQVRYSKLEKIEL